MSAEIVKRLRHQFLSGPALSCDQQRRAGRADVFGKVNQRIFHLPHCGTVSDNVVDAILCLLGVDHDLLIIAQFVLQVGELGGEPVDLRPAVKQDHAKASDALAVLDDGNTMANRGFIMRIHK